LLDNLGNQMKARYHYLVKDYPPLFAYFEEVKQGAAVLFGRIELLAMEACALYQSKDRAGGARALREAYETASPNGITMPFIELGKDMRTLITSALRAENSDIPRPWLELINRKSAYYAKQQAIVTASLEKANIIGGGVDLSSRELEVLRDLYGGLSQSQIAEKRKISVSSVKTVYKILGQKLEAHSLTDIIRNSVERKLV